MATSANDEDKRKFFLRIMTALFYGVSSFMIMVVNKRVLSV